MACFESVGVIKNQPNFDDAKLNDFKRGIESLRGKVTWDKDDIVKLYFSVLPDLHTRKLANI